jgi:hypothetical protein
VASQAQTTPLTTSTQALYIGGNSPYGEYFQGRIDEVRIYNRALTATEIQTDMNTPVSGSPPPTLTITGPPEGASITGITVNVSYTVSGNLTEVNHVHFQVDTEPEVMDMTLDGAYQLIGVFVGSHVLKGYLVRADHSKIFGTDAVPISFTTVPDPADPTPPTVSMTAPAEGATVSGSITVSANATDNVGVYGVRFLVDGARIGSEDKTSPYSIPLDTTTLINGPHSLTALARDVAGNQTTSSPVTVTVSNISPTDPSQIGQWASPFTWPIVAIHMTLLPTGKVLTWDDHSDNPPGEVWNPATNSFASVPYTPANLFCAGHTALPDGRILVDGGHVAAYVGIPDTTIFDPTTEAWSAAAPMSYARWYPTVTTLADGRVLAVSGAINCPTCINPTGSHAGIADIPEVYNPTTNTWTRLTNASLSLPLYPHMFLLPDGRVLATSTAEDPIVSRVLDLNTQAWTVVDPVIVDGGSSAMYLPGKIIKSGTAWNPDYPPAPSIANTYVLDMGQTSPAWRQSSPMAFPRTQHNLTLLPDGTVLATGGSRNSDVFDLAPAVYEAELWSPTTETWKTVARMQVPRVYHSTALLLPDGRVLSAGGGHPEGFGVAQFSAEIYSPAYLFKGPRPIITSAPTAPLQHGGSFFVQTPDASRIAMVSLVRTGSVTHAFDANQRFLPLTFQQASGGLTVQSPGNAYLAPPGYYMLFLVDTNGVPSVGSFVRFPSPGDDVQPPSPPSGLTVTSSTGRVSLSWSAATDNVGVAGYNIHRSTSPGFVPTTANRVGQTNATVRTYTDTGFVTSETYYYVVTAQDAAGNISPPSNEIGVPVTADTTVPTVSMTAPAQGATVSGIITVSADAADDVGVVGVQFLLDGAPLGVEDGTAPYSILWDTSRAGNGSHALAARARDATGNTATTLDVIVSVFNAVPSGLVAAYSFNEGSGTIVGDSSGNANTGALSGTTWTTAGKFGSALVFNGTNARVTINDSNSLDLTTGMTLEAWVYPTVTPSGWRTIVDKSTDIYYLMASSGQNTPAVGATFAAGNQNTYAPSALPVNTWAHVAATYDGAMVRLYVNGVQVASQAQTTPLTTSTQALYIGGNSPYGEYFQGRIDEVRIYNRALSATDIQFDMATPLP